MAAPRTPILTPRRVAAGVLALGVVAATGVVLAVYQRREAIAVRFAFDYLRDRGVPAEIHLDHLDLGGASGSVRLGPKASPDLTVKRAEARFGALPAPWAGLRPPPVRALTLIAPTLHGRWRDGRLDFGSLQPLIDQALQTPPKGRPPIDLHIQDGVIDLDTPAGAIAVALDATLEGGRLRSLHLRLEPVDLTLGGVRVAHVQGVVSGVATGSGALHLTGALGAAQARGPAGATGLVATLEALVPNALAAAPAGAAAPVDATVRLKAVRLALQTVAGAPLVVDGADAALDLSGDLDGHGGFGGKAHLAGRAGRVARGGLALDTVVLRLRSEALRVDMGAAGAVGPFDLALSAAGGRWRAGGLDGTLTPLRLKAGGRFASAPTLSLEAAGDLQGGGGLDRPEAARLAQTAVGTLDPSATSALARVLERAEVDAPGFAVAIDSRRGLDLRLPRGATATVAGGALELRPLGAAAVFRGGLHDRSGAADLRFQARDLPEVSARAPAWRIGPDGVLRARLELSMRGDFGPVRGGVGRVSGELVGRDGRWSATASQCAPLQAAALRLGAVTSDEVTGQACPEPGAALMTYATGGWRLRSRLAETAFALPSQAARVRLAGAEVDLSGGRAGLSGRVALQDAVVEDIASVRRWRPLRVNGPLTLAGGTIDGRLALAIVQPAMPLGGLRLHVRPADGTGEAAFVGAPWVFASGGLQPGDVLPAAGPVLPQAEGGLQVLARFAWTRAGLTSSGEARSGGLSFHSPAGRIDGVRGEVRFTSLAPLATATGQTLAADRLETLLPLETLRATFSLAPDRLILQGASADAAGGRLALDPMQVPLASGAAASAITGVLRLKGVDAERVISVLNLSDAVSLQARLDGAMPFTLEPDGAGGRRLRIAGGHVAADGPGRLTISRRTLAGVTTCAGEATGDQPNAVQDFAYQALEDLAFTRLDATVDSRPGGRMGAVFHVAGEHDPAVSKPTRVGLWALLRGHAFDKPLPLPKGTPVDLTLDTSLNLDDVLGALNQAARRGSAPVQP